MAEKAEETTAAILQYLRTRVGDTPPSIREIGAACGIASTSCVHRHLRRLEERGLIERDPFNSRSVRLAGSRCTMVPLVGRITAGLPILAVEQIEGYLPYPAESAENCFALHVVGQSMIGAGIFDGDIIVARQTQYAENGDIVVALIGEEATVKRFFCDNGKIRLQPENPDFEPIYPDECRILGRIIAAIHEF